MKKLRYSSVIYLFKKYLHREKVIDEEKIWNYYVENKPNIHEASLYLLDKLLWNLKEMKYVNFFKWYNSSKSYLKEKYKLPGNQLKNIDNELMFL